MRFSQGAAASVIATTMTTTVAVAVVSASSSSHAGAATTTSQSSVPDPNVPLFHHHQQQQQQDYADTGILSSRGLVDLAPSSSSSSSAFYDHDDHQNDGIDGEKKGGGNDGSSSNNRELATVAAWCPQSYVTCNNGMDASNPTRTCAAACLDFFGTAMCCSGSNACASFTGKVCMDLTSCMGSRACEDAKIPQVKNSCQGTKACNQVAAPSATAGVVGNFINSCNGSSACYQAGKNGGAIGNILNSCIGDGTCKQMASDGGKVGNIQDSCVGAGTCPECGNTGGTVGDITSSCKADVACPAIGVQGGKVGNIVNSCTTLKSCFVLGYKGVVGNIQDSCTADYACYKAGGGAGGSIGSITASCKANNACYYAGKDPNSIGSSKNLDNCCNVADSCKNASAATLPAECLATESPTTAPTALKATESPTTAPTALKATESPTRPTAPKPSTSITKAPTKSPVFVTLSFVGGCPAQISDALAVHFEPGDRVSKGAIVFECKSWPNSLFCSQAAFNPPDDLDSKSTDWKQAWDVVGHCTGTLTPPTAGCPDVWTSGDMTKYKENDQVSVIKSSSPLIQLIYRCKAWPYSWYCGQLSPLNYNGGKLGWEIVGECSGTMGPTTSPTFDPLTAMIDGCPQEYSLDAIKNYMAGDKVSVAVEGSTLYKNVFVCREFPYSGFCSQSGFAPGEQYDYMAWTLLGPCEGTLAPTSAPSPYSGGDSCTYTKVVTTTPTPTPVVTPVGTWTVGTLYEAGDQVRIGAKKFQCKPWPFYLWCRMSAYKPTLSETGLWTEAWTVAGTCPAVV